MPLAPANQSQLIRACQKDEYYQTLLRNNTNEAFQTLAGSKRWLDWRKEVELLSDVAYFGLTTLTGYQTLGEEYVNIIQVDPSLRRVPTPARRGVFVFCHSFLPYLLDKVLVCLENELEGVEGPGWGTRRRQVASGRWSLELWLRRFAQRAVGLLSEPQRRKCLPAVFVLQQTLSLLHRCHLALFYLSGLFYYLSKRTAGIRHLRVSGLRGNDRTIRTSYRLLGAISLFHLLLTLCLQLKNLRLRQSVRQEWKIYRHLTDNPPQTQKSKSKASHCILCLEERKHPTSTPCGHLFCWECITEWCDTKAECPLCREKFQPHKLLYLRNYN